MSVEFDKGANSARSMAVVSDEEKHLGMEHLIWWSLCLIESKVTVGFTRKLALPVVRFTAVSGNKVLYLCFSHHDNATRQILCSSTWSKIAIGACFTVLAN